MLARTAPMAMALLLAMLAMSSSSSGVYAQLGGGLPRHTNPAMAGVSEAFSHSDSATTLYSSDNYLKCTSTQHLTPTSTSEISELIQRYTSLHDNLKIRATRRGFHSSAGFVCSGRRESSKPEFRDTSIESQESLESPSVSVTLLMHRMNRVVGVDSKKFRVTVEAGMTTLELVNAAEANDMSVPAGALSIYGNLTVGGVILASAHGSGLGTISSLGDLVTAVKWVNAKGEIIVSDLETEQGEKEVRAFVGGLGLLGVATEFTLQLQPNSRTIVETRIGLSDENIAEDLVRTMKTETPHVIAFWRPDFGTYKLVMFKQVKEGDEDTPTFYPEGTIAYMTQVDSKLSSAWSELMAKWEDDAAEESASAEVMNADVCEVAKIMHDIPMFSDGTSTTPLAHGTIPTNNAMVSTDCSPDCYFHVHSMGTFIDDTEFTLKLSQFSSWIADAKRIVKHELTLIEARLHRHHHKHITRCMPPGYFWLRFGKANQNLLSTATGTEDVVHVQWTSLHSAKVPNKLAKQSTITETLEQMTLCKYKGRPHWGKNHERVFQHPQCNVLDNFPSENVEALKELQRVHDPKRVFEPELFGELLARRRTEKSGLCTPHFWCYCEEDAHCPGGHACLPSGSFPEYKICTVVDTVSGTSHRETNAEL